MKKDDDFILKTLTGLDERWIEEADPYKAEASNKAASVGTAENVRAASRARRLRIITGVAAVAAVLILGIAIVKLGIPMMKPSSGDKPVPVSTPTMRVDPDPTVPAETGTPTPYVPEGTPTLPPYYPEDTPTPTPYIPETTPTPTMYIPETTPTPTPYYFPIGTPTPTPYIPEGTPTPTPNIPEGTPTPTPTPGAVREELTQDSADRMIQWFTTRLEGHFDEVYVMVYPEDKIEEISEKYRADYGMPQDRTLYEYVEAQFTERAEEVKFGTDQQHWNAHLRWSEVETPGSEEMSLRDAGPEIQRMIREAGVELPEDATVYVETVKFSWHYDDETVERTKQFCVYSYNGCLYIAGIRVDDWM